MTKPANYDREEAVAATLRALADTFASLPGLPEALVHAVHELREALQPETSARQVKAAALVLSAVCETAIRRQGL